MGWETRFGRKCVFSGPGRGRDGAGQGGETGQCRDEEGSAEEVDEDAEEGAEEGAEEMEGEGDER